MLIFTFQTIKQKLGMNLSLNPVSFTDIYMKNISKKTMDINQIMFRLDDGLVDLLFQTNSNVLKNHLIFHTLLVSFMRDIKKEEEEFTLQTQDQKSHQLLDFLQESFTGFSTKEFVNLISKRY